MAVKRQELSDDERRTLRAFAAAAPPVRINRNDRMFMRLFNKGMVIGTIGRDERGDHVGIVKLTERGRQALEQFAEAG